jgi:uncharacterized protein YndB with AHSA1/START domain
VWHAEVRRNRNTSGVPKVAATRELLAPREDVWKFLAQPYHLSDWWPGVHGVRPSRQGLAPGARWEVTVRPQGRGILGTFLGGPHTTRTLMVLDVRTNELVRFIFAEDGLEAELVLESTGHDHTQATLTIDGAWLRRNASLPRSALNRLHSLCQTAPEL